MAPSSDKAELRSLAVLYATVGQRLGYPLKLVPTKTDRSTHLFLRWENGRERFNIEPTAHGFVANPDAYYRVAPYSVSPDDEQNGGFLRCMTPREEMACYLVHRAHCWLDHGNHRAAAEALAWASAIVPASLFYRHTLAKVLNEWSDALKVRKPPRFPPMQFSVARRYFPEALPAKTERDFHGLSATQNLLDTHELDEKWWRRLREGSSAPTLPLRTLVEINEDGGSRIRFEFPEPFRYT